MAWLNRKPPQLAPSPKRQLATDQHARGEIAMCQRRIAALESSVARLVRDRMDRELAEDQVAMTLRELRTLMAEVRKLHKAMKGA